MDKRIRDCLTRIGSLSDHMCESSRVDVWRFVRLLERELTRLQKLYQESAAGSRDGEH